MATYKNIFVYFLWTCIASTIFAVWIYGEFEFLYEMRYSFSQTHLDEYSCWYLAAPSYILFLTFSITIGIFICVSKLKDIIVIHFRTVTVLMCCVQITVYLWFNTITLLDLQPTTPICYHGNNTHLDGVLPFNETYPVLSCHLPDKLEEVHYTSQNILDFDSLLNGSSWMHTVVTTREIQVNSTLNTTEVTTDSTTHIKYILTNDTGLADRIRNIGENKYVFRVFMGLITGHLLLVLLQIMEQLWIVCRTSKPSKERFHVMVSEQFIAVVQGLDNYDILCRYLLTNIALFSVDRVSCYVTLAGFTLVLFLTNLVSRFTSAGFYHWSASRIGHGSGVLALVTALVLIALRGYLTVAPARTLGSYRSLSDAVFVLVELYIVYGLVMLGVVTAKLPPDNNQVEPGRVKYREALYEN